MEFSREGKNMAERLMAEGTQGPGPEGPQQTPQGGVAVAEKPPDQPNVVIADEGKEPKGSSFWEKITGERTKPLILVKQPLVTEISNPEEQIENTQGPSTPNQTQAGEANTVNNQEIQGGQGAGVGNLPPDRGDGGGGRSEGPRGPEVRGPEWETSPERGKMLVDEIIRVRTEFSYQERYRMKIDDSFLPSDYLTSHPEIYSDEGLYLSQLYEDLQEYVDLLCEERNDPDPFGPQKAYPRPARRDPNQPIVPPEFPPLPQAIRDMNDVVEQFRTQYQLEGAEETGELEGFPDEALPTMDISTRRGQYNNPTSREEFQAAQADLQVYFRQAQNQGLLKEVNAALNSIYQEIVIATGRGIPPTQIQETLDQRIARVRQFAQIEFQEKSLADPNIPQQLSGVGDAYIDWAVRRLQRSLNGQPQVEDRQGEWIIPTPEQASRDEKETYWETTSYPKYYHITARNREQFLIAKETFFQMIRTGSVGKSPTAIFEHVKNFIEVFGSEGGRQVREGNIDLDFLTENRLELEALLYVFVGSYSKEVYNPKQSKEAMMAMSLDEGPARWIALYRAGKGGIATFTHMFDVESLMDIYNNSVGERGELDIVAGHFLQDQIQERVIERGLGIVLKDYDPRDEYFNADDLGAKIAAAADLERIKSDLSKIEQDIRSGRIKLRPGETASSLLGGDNQVKREHDQARSNAYRANLQRLGLTKSDEEFKELYESFDKGDYHIKNYQRFVEDQSKPEGQRQYPTFTKLPESIRKSIDSGRIQAELQGFRQAIRDGRIRLEKGQKAIDLLSPRDRQIYQAAYDEASANFDIAFQMQGVLGEKARRGRGFLYVDRNPHLQYYYKVGDELRLKWVDKDRTEVTNIDTLDVSGIAKIRDSLPQDHRRSFEIGWMLSKMRDGKALTTFPQAWQDSYNQLSPEDKNDFWENIPVYQAENWVNWGIYWTKMKYADDPAKARRQKVREARKRLIEEISTQGYAAQLWDDELGLEGQPKLMTFKRPLGRIDSNTGQFTKYTNDQVLGFNQAGEEAKLSFDGNGNPRGLDFDQNGKVIIYDKADSDNRQRVNYDNINKDTKAKLVGDTLVEEAVATFQIAAQSSDFRNRYTDHTYWYYQGNNKDTILTPRVRAAAERIWDGLSRPEDEDILATQLLIVDPTLRRVRKFEGVQQAREVALIAAAVLESFQDKQRTKHALHRAFLPKDGYAGRMRTGYRNEDWAGIDRFTMGFEEFAGQQPLRFARRGAAWIASVPFEHDAAGPRWGAHGVSGAIKVMADEIKKFSHQGIVGQFGLTKIFEVMDKANVDMFNHLVGYVDPQTGEWVFGLLEKPTDNNETMHGFTEDAQAGKILPNPTKTIPFLYKYKECFGRLTAVTHDMRTMYSAVDNSAGAINLEEVDVFDLTDGSFNTAIETNRSILSLYLMNGTARNRQDAFLYGEEDWIGFYEWLQDKSPGGGADVYRREAYWNSFLNKSIRAYKGEKGTEEDVKINVWMTEKII